MKGTAAEVDKITKATYGTPTIAAVETTEKAIKFVTAPTATSGTKLLTVAGSTDVGGYVYCAVSKAATARFRVLNATNATNATTPAKAEATSMSSEAFKQKYNIKRAETKVKALSFSFSFEGLGEGKTYSWMCEATSLNPSNPQFRSAAVSGSQATTAAKPVVTGDSALWSSLFAAILMIAAVFFY